MASRPQVDSNLVMNSQVAQGVAIIGDRWGFMILRDAFLGVRRFEEFRQRGNIARGTLASRLKSLVEHGILYKTPYQSAPLRYEYRLTEMGLDLYPNLLMSWAWETKWGKGRYLPQELVHKSCGKQMQPLLRCSHCHVGVRPQDVSFSPGNSAQLAEKVGPRHQRRSKSKEEFVDGAGDQTYTMLDVIGDRWTSLVVAAAFFGLKRYDEIASTIGIATNILADRLKLLVHIGVLDRVKYQDRPKRFEYHLSEMGRDLYLHAITIHEWADRWLIREGESPMSLRHIPCDQPFVSESVCGVCQQPLVASEVTFDKEIKNREAV